MALWEPALKLIRVHEGGFANQKGDSGGVTMYGVSLRWLRSLKYDLDRDGDVDKDDVMAVTPALQGELFRQHFWVPCRGDEIVDQSIATKLVDLAVNAGVRAAVRVLQRAINDLGGPVNVDGQIGTKTLAAANAVAPRPLVGAFALRQRAFYEDLVEGNQELRKFLGGWLKRASWVGESK